MVRITGEASRQIQQFMQSSKTHKSSKLDLDINKSTRSTMISGKELISRMKGAPKFDTTFGGLRLRGRSTEYKNTIVELSKYHEMSQLFGGTALGSSSAKGQVEQLKTKLQNIIDSAEKYIGKHDGNETKSGRTQVMHELIDMARTELGHLSQAVEEGNRTFGSETSLADALGLYKSGVTDKNQVNRDLCDDNLRGPPQQLGSGVLNTVYLAKYTIDDRQEEPRVLKPLSNKIQHLEGKMGAIGIAKDDLRNAARNIASSNVAEMLGVPDMLPKSDVVIQGGKPFLAMQLAPGESMLSKVEVKVTDKELIRQYNLYESEGMLDGDMIKDMGISLRRDPENGDWLQKVDGHRDISLIKGGGNDKLAANMQRNLLDLQTLDVLCGQVDRHQYNYFVKVDGDSVNVTAIDNDMSFGKETTGIKGLSKSNTRNGNDQPYCGAPPLMSRDMFNKLQAIDPVEFRVSLSGAGLNADEVDAATSRLADLKNHANTLLNNGCIVDNFETWLSKDVEGSGRLNASDYLMQVHLPNYVQSGQASYEKADRDQVPLVPLDPGKHGTIQN